MLLTMSPNLKLYTQVLILVIMATHMYNVNPIREIAVELYHKLYIRQHTKPSEDIAG